MRVVEHNLPLLFWSSLDSRISRHSRLLAEAPSLTNFRVQFQRGALQYRPNVRILAILRDARLGLAQHSFGRAHPSTVSRHQLLPIHGARVYAATSCGLRSHQVDVISDSVN